MPVRQIRAVGLDALLLATKVLQRARRADPHAGVWEAADIQWWWREPRRSDEVEELFWVDDQGPVAAVLLTSWTDGVWQCDPVVVPGASSVESSVVWGEAMGMAAEHAPEGFDVPVSDDEPAFRQLAERCGLTPGEQDSTAWMDAADRPAVPWLPGGFVLADRSQRRGTSHPMRQRNGAAVAQRLMECPLYDPTLDLAIETTDGRVAGYSLYWFDPTTEVGLVEPVRIEDEFQRLGLAQTMLAVGIDRLATRGAGRVKVSYETEAAGALYRRVGFEPTSTATWYRGDRDAATRVGP